MSWRPDDDEFNAARGRERVFTHIHLVQVALHRAIVLLQLRQLRHDESKLEPPELLAFASIDHPVRYNSPEYWAKLARVKDAVEHHYRLNRHHPEHFDMDVRRMSLIDLLEMLCDWWAASQRHSDVERLDMNRSIEINQERFHFSDELAGILRATARILELD